MFLVQTNQLSLYKLLITTHIGVEHCQHISKQHQRMLQMSNLFCDDQSEGFQNASINSSDTDSSSDEKEVPPVLAEPRKL